MDGFPYAPRPGQEALVNAIHAAQSGGRHLATESGTGTGKTACALHAGQTACQGDGRRLIYTTRTNSQQSQVVKEHRMRRDGTLLVPLMGRKHYCPLLKDDARFAGATSEELGRLCKDAKRKALQAHATGRPVEGACPFYERLLDDGTGPVEALLHGHAGDVGDLATQIAQAGSCAYEAFKLILPEANAVVAPYVFLLDTRLRDTLMQWMGTTPDACHLIVDEAHNLPDATRQHHSPRLGLITIERALKEAERLQDPFLGGHVQASRFLATLHRAVRTLVDEHAGPAEDGWMPPDALDEMLMVRLCLPGPALAKVVQDLHQWGEAVREDLRQAGKLPRSYLGAVAAFLDMWQDARDGPFVHLASREPRPSLEAFLIDPAARLAWLHEFASTTHMSGTLAPLDSYKVATGLPDDAVEWVMPTPFAPENLRIYGVHGHRRSFVAMQEDPEAVARQQQAARELLAIWHGRIGVWFPSHKSLRDYVEEGFLHGVEASIHQETPDMTTPELMRLVERFAHDPAPRTLLLGVLGGRLSEGIDYPGEAMDHAVLLGVPYPKPSAKSQALIHHYDRVAEAGWRIAVHEPVGRTMRQAIGRLIRGPDDRADAVVLDERVIRFKDRFDRLEMIHDVSGIGGPPPTRPAGFETADRLS